MITNHFIELDANARQIVCTRHRIALVAALKRDPIDWDAVHRERERIDAITLLGEHDRIALDQAEFDNLQGAA